MWPKKVHSAIALDIGPGSVSLCQLARRAGRLGLHCWGVMEDPLREQPQAADPPALPVERTARLVSQSGFHGRAAALALKPPEAAFHAATMPDALRGAPRAQQLATLQFDAARRAQVDPADVSIDFWPLPPGNRTGHNVMVAAVRREVVDRWAAFFHTVGLELSHLDVLPHALLRGAWRIGLPGAGEQRPAGECLWGVLDMGFSGSVLAINLGDTCVYVRTSPIGGDSLTTAVGHTLKVGYGTAETLKRRHAPGAIPGDNGDSPAEPVLRDPTAQPRGGDGLHDLVHSVLRSRLRLLADDIGRAFAYAMESYPESTPIGLYVCGGGAKLADLPEMLQGLLGVEVARLNPCSDIVLLHGALPVQEPHQANLAACVGLALGDVG